MGVHGVVARTEVPLKARTGTDEPVTNAGAILLKWMKVAGGDGIREGRGDGELPKRIVGLIGRRVSSAVRIGSVLIRAAREVGQMVANS